MMNITELHWEITNSCNMECRHCLVEAGSTQPRELTTQAAFRAVEKLDQIGVSQIKFTGGEPFYREDFKEILTEAYEHDIGMQILTNGLLLDHRTLGFLREKNISLGISLDGAHSTTHDLIRGKGAFAGALQVMKECQKLGVNFTLYVTVNGQNYEELGEIAKLGKSYGASGVHFSEINLEGRAANTEIDLALSQKQKAHLPFLAEEISENILAGEGLSKGEQGCWAGNGAAYMDSEGNLFPCVEVALQRPDLTFGNIRTLNPEKLLDGNYYASFSKKECPYEVWTDEALNLIANVDNKCPLAPSKEVSINTLPELYQALDRLFQGIEEYCFSCDYPDCLGYIWLLDEEAARLREMGVDILRVNENIKFIHSFSEAENGRIDVSERYPACSQVCSERRRCSIHEDRPLVCRLYPIGLETDPKQGVVWGLHEDCLYVKKLRERNQLQDFKERFLEILEGLSPELEAEILTAYYAVDSVSCFPAEQNSYTTLREGFHV